jgi:excisionase family DNA binding protein
MSTNTPDPTITRSEAAKYLGISMPTLNRWLKKAIITRYWVEGVALFDADELAIVRKKKEDSI